MFELHFSVSITTAFLQNHFAPASTSKYIYKIKISS